MSDGVIRAWAAWMGPMAVQVSALALAVWLVDGVWLRRRAWPGLRYALWCLVALKLVLPPAVASPVSVSAPVLDATSMPSAAAFPTSLSLPALLMAAWALGALLLASAHLVSAGRLRRRIQRDGMPAGERAQAALRCAAARLGLRRKPALRIMPDMAVAAAFGALRPTVLLAPRYADDGAASDEELEHVLLHECAHIARGDLWAQTGFALLNIVYWFHPLVFLARRRAHALRELCCDLTVAARLGGDTPAYRRTLLRAAGRTLTPSPGAGFFGGSSILQRLHALDVERWRRPGWRPAGALAVLVLLTVTVLPMASVPLPRLPATNDVTAARAHLLRTQTERDRFGCFHRQAAYFQLAAAEAAAKSIPSGGSR